MWLNKIPFLRQSKKFYDDFSYKNVPLWPIMAGEFYKFYNDPITSRKEKAMFMFKFLFTMDKFNIKGQAGRILVSYPMARDDHYELVKKAIQGFPKNEIIFLDNYTYKKKSSKLKFKFRLPNIFLLFKIMNRFRKSNMRKILGKNYWYFLIRTYFRCKQIDELRKIYDKYKPRAHIGFCAQAFPEDAMLTYFAKQEGKPTFTLQHGFLLDADYFMSIAVLQENIISDYYLVWGDATANLLEKYTDKKNVIVVGNPKYKQEKFKKKTKFNPKKALILFPVVNPFETSKKLLKIMNKFISLHPEIEFNVSVHPFDDLNKYKSQLNYTNVGFIPKGVSINDAIKESDFLILHNTTLSLEALQYGIPIFRFQDDFLIDLWKNNDKFKDMKELDALLKKVKNQKISKKWQKIYAKEFKNNFYMPKNKQFQSIIMNKLNLKYIIIVHKYLKTF